MAKLEAIAAEFAPEGFIMSWFEFVPRMMALRKVGFFSPEALDAVVQRMETVCQRHGVPGVDSIDIDVMGQPGSHLN